jgi:hypothetical protein
MAVQCRGIQGLLLLTDFTLLTVLPQLFCSEQFPSHGSCSLLRNEIKSSRFHDYTQRVP